MEVTTSIAVIYAYNTVDVPGLADQVGDCRRMADVLALPVARVFVDDGKRATIDRPGITNMLEFIEAEGQETRVTVLITQLSRLAGSEGISFEGKLVGLGCSVTTLADLDMSPSGESPLHAMILEAFNQHQRYEHSQAIKRGIARAKRRRLAHSGYASNTDEPGN